MALQPLSVGDILMLSTTAWKIGRAFTQGRKGAPAQFAEVEREANGLSESLKRVAEALHDPESNLISRAQTDTKEAVNTILESAQRTLADLESFVERYQVIKKRTTDRGGFVVERSWSDAVIVNYKTFKWMTEGGTLTDLRNMLQMHSSTINLTLQALQSRSLARLEMTVLPMAENVASIHDAVHDELADKLDHLHRVVMALATSISPTLTAQSDQNRLSHITLPESRRPLETPPTRVTSYKQSELSEPHDVSLKPAPLRSHRDTAHSIPTPSPNTRPRDRSRMDFNFESGSPPEDSVSIAGAVSPGDLRDSALPSRESSLSRTLSRENSKAHICRPESTTLGQLLETLGQEAVSSASSVSPPPRYPSSSSRVMSKLPSPAILPESPQKHIPATPATILKSPQSPQSPSQSPRLRTSPEFVARSLPPNSPRSPLGPTPSTPPIDRLSLQSRPTSIRDQAVPSPVLPPSSDQSPFVRSLMRNAAILCDVRGRLIEYVQRKPEEHDPRWNTEMVAACHDARICVIRRRENREHGGTKVITSVWALSNKGEIRMQQKLPELSETVPFCSYFESEKVSLQPSPEQGEIVLRYHTESWGEEIKEEKKTNWVNYVFQSSTDAFAFQSAVYGRMLIGSYRTTKTTVIHEGLKGTFSFEEQFAKIEMLRLWQDDGITTPGASGGVLALMHVSSSFGEGWARFWINNAAAPVKIKEDGGKYARIKGIDLQIVKPGATVNRVRSPNSAAGDADSFFGPVSPALGGKKGPIKKVTGIRIEFKTEAERDGFVSIALDKQNNSVALPDL